MKRITTFVCVTVALAAIGTGTSSGSTAQKATLRLVDTEPLTLRGANFEPSERVSVTVSGQSAAGRGAARATHRMAASSAGVFVVRFPSIDANACEGFSVTAVGSGGSKATYKRPPGSCPHLD